MFSLFDKDKPKAAVREGMLVVSLTNAVSPVVWRLDMRQVTASALEIRENDDGNYDMVLKTQKGDMNHIATFDDRQKAVKALKVVMQAIEEAPFSALKVNSPGYSVPSSPTFSHGEETRSAVSPDIPGKMSSKGRPVLAGVIGACVIVLIIVLMGVMGGGQRMPANLQPSSASAETVGAPVSADDFLRARQP